MEILLSSGEGDGCGNPSTPAESAKLFGRARAAPGEWRKRAFSRIEMMDRVTSTGPRWLPRRARQSILRQILKNLFQGSREQLVAALLDAGSETISTEELDRLAAQIDAARKAGR